MQVTNNQLSKREQEILCLVATGASNKEIAKELYISTNTVKVHLRNIFAKIGVNSRTEAAMYAVNSGIVPGTKPSGGVGGSANVIEPPLEGGRKRSITALFFFLVVAAFALVTFFLWRSTQPSLEGADLNILTSQWGILASMPTARSGLAVAIHENYIYAIAGDTGGGVANVVERYDPVTDDWIRLASKPTAIKDVGAAVIGGKIYVPGGQLASGKATDILEIYDPREDSWSVGKPLPEALSAYAITAYEGRLYLFGGWDGEQYLTSVYEYNPVDDTWMSKSPLSVGRAYAGAAVAGGKIYIMGGYNGSQALTINEIYQSNLDDGVNNPWEIGAPIPEGRYAFGMESIVDSIVIIGGNGNNEKQLPILNFYHSKNEWQSTSSQMIFPKWTNMRLVQSDIHLFGIGGLLNNEPSSINLALQTLYTVSIPILR